jgi:hypothetical protein
MLPADIPTSADISCILFHQSLYTTLCTNLIFSSIIEVDSCLQLYHLKNIYATFKPMLFSFLPYHMLLQVFVVSEGDLHSRTQTFMFVCCSVANISKCNKSAIHRNKHLTTMTTMPKMIEIALK